MKITRKQLRNIIKEAVAQLSENKGCPEATQDKKINAENKKKAASNKKIMYGHPKEVEVLSALAEKKQLCGNCVAFDITPQMVKCGGANEKGTVGYCKMHDFSCAAQKTCLTWAPGGPKKE